METLRRRGFSLGEILVAVAIMAVLAAVILPSIGSQLNKGESARLASDLTNIRAGLEQFLADVRRYPHAMSQLQTKPTALTAADTGINGSGQFTALQVARWKGPYLTKDYTTTGITGYGAAVTALFKVCNDDDPPVCTADPTGQLYVTINIVGISEAEATEVDAALDDGVITTGMVRYNTVNSLFQYLALPIQ